MQQKSVGMLNGAQAMDDDESVRPEERGRSRLANQQLRFGVHLEVASSK